MPNQTSGSPSSFNAADTTLDMWRNPWCVQSERSHREPIITFHSVSDSPGWEKVPGWISNLVKKRGTKDVLEVGSGANPTLCPEIVAALEIRYTANDVSHAELVKADRVFDHWVCNLASDEIPTQMRGRIDLVFSRMVNEHIYNAQTYHGQIHSLLKPGELAAHCFLTFYSLPFVANRILPDSMSAILLNLFGRRDLHKHGGFRAYYSGVAVLRQLCFRVSRHSGMKSKSLQDILATTRGPFYLRDTIAFAGPERKRAHGKGE